MPQAQPELKKYLDKRLFVQLNGSRKVLGVLRGYDVRKTPLNLLFHSRAYGLEDRYNQGWTHD
ncbi:MAG: hypothetical protein L6R38_004195 [Xanthoria sp. 2 TBL-2021]|nr:MAG: hypothetical protein L6R38_004195 [Xanthoria sp. 2 TBL-2021]